jgi:protein KRI1
MSLGKKKSSVTVSISADNSKKPILTTFSTKIMFPFAVKNISESEDSSEDDVSTDEELVNPEFDKEFFKTLAFLKNKDEKKYDEIPNFFENVPPIEETVQKTKELKKSSKPVTVADHQREILLKTEGKMSDDEEESEQNGMSYVAEQEQIKKDLKKALMANESEDDDDKLFKVRDKSETEAENERKNYEKWLLTQKKSKSFKPLKDFWTSNELSKDDKFLRDYILNRDYVNNGVESEFKDVVGISDDEKEVEQQDEYEHKYNFRFEEPDNDFIKRYPRTIGDSVRADDTSRKDKRKERDERKAKEKELKMKELRELQNIRKREIEEKLLILKDVAGRDDFTLKEDDLNTDFDPEAHDRRMAEFFDNEYYGIDEGDQKPQFDDIDEELNIENWDNFDKSKVPNDADDDEEEEGGGGGGGPHCEDAEFNMDCDYDPKEEKRQKLQRELMDMTKGRKRKKKVSKLAALIKKDKPVYNPTEWKSYEEYLDEYYKLDFEDIIGDQPCRFNYTECVPNDFGLTVAEVS